MLRSRSQYKTVGTLGDTLVTRLQSKNQAEATSAFDSVVGIAKKMDLSKQVSFVTQLMENESKLTSSPLLQQMKKAYSSYCDDAAAEAIRNKYNDRKKDLFEQANVLKGENLKKNKKARKKVDKQLKVLEKEYKEQMDALHDEGEKKSLKTTLSACYAEIQKHLNEPILWENPLKQLFAAPPGYPDKGFHAPVLEVVGSNPKHFTAPSKLDLRKALETDPKMENYLFLGFKEGGANNPGQLGARYLFCYQDKSGKIQSQVIFCKQATDDCLPNHRENIAEVVAGRLMNRVIGDYAASTYFAIQPHGTKGNPEDSYVTSIYFDNLADTHTAALLASALDEFNERTGEIPTEEQIAQITGKLRKRGYGKLLAGKGAYSGQNIDSSYLGHPTFRPGTQLLMNNTEIEQTSQGKSLMASLLFGNDQIHSENAGLADFPGDKPGKVQRAYCILDFGGAFRRPYTTTMGITRENDSGRFMHAVTPESTDNKKYGVAYLLAYPPEVRYSAAFIKGLDAVAQFNFHTLQDEVNKSVDYAIEYYGAETFASEFATELDTTNHRLSDPTTVRDETKTFLIDTLSMRQLSLREYSLRSKLENIRMKTGKGETPDFDLHRLAEQNPIYFLFERIPETKEKCLSTFSSPNEYVRFNEYIMGTRGLDLHNTDFSKDRRVKLTAKLWLMLQRCQEFIDKNDHVFFKALANSLESFMENDDTALFSKVCDEAYLLLRKTYKKIHDEGLYESYFLSHLANTARRLTIEVTPKDKLSSPDLLSTVFNEAAPSKAINDFTQNIFDNCGALKIIEDLRSQDFKLENLTTALQEHENESLLTSAQELATWTTLPENTLNGFCSFIKTFYAKLPALIFDDTSNLQPWLVQALGYNTLKEATAKLGNNQVKIQLFQALENFLKDTLRSHAEPNPDLQQFMEIATQLLDHQDNLLQQFFNQLTALERSKNMRLPKPFEDSLATVITGSSTNLQALLENPVNNINEFTKTLIDSRSALADRVLDARELDRITSETILIESATPIPHSPVGTDNSRGVDFPLTLHQVSFTKLNDAIVNIEITECGSAIDNKPISDLTEIDNNYLNLAAILENDAKTKYPELAFFKDCQEFFWATINELRQDSGMVTQDGLFTALKNVLEKELDDKSIQEIAKNLFNTYLNSTEQLDPDGSGNFYPNDIFIRTALHQVESYTKLSGETHPHIYISDAWDPHYAEAIALVCSLKKCQCTNESGWQMVAIDEPRKAAFSAFYNNRFNDPHHKINTYPTPRETTTLSKNPYRFYMRPQITERPPGSGFDSGSGPSSP